MRKIKLIVLVLSLLSFVIGAEEATAKSDTWEPFRFFVGRWEGAGEGKAGVSKGKLEVKFQLNGKFLQFKNESVFEPQEKNPGGERHEDFGFISYDKTRGKFVFRQFHVEGFINQYVLDTISDDQKTCTFVSESIENGPPGLQCKLIYTVINDNEFQQIFELSFPGKEFECYMKGTMKRKKE